MIVLLSLLLLEINPSAVNIECVVLLLFYRWYRRDLPSKSLVRRTQRENSPLFQTLFIPVAKAEDLPITV